MRRRDFLRLSVLASGSAICARQGIAQTTPVESAHLRLDPRRAGNTIGPEFTGLSYETAQLSDPNFFSPANTGLVAFVRRLGPSGILRVGGNTSEYSYWTPDKPSAMGRGEDTMQSSAAGPVGPDTGKKAAAPRKITPLAIRNLHGFIEATGWKLIYGLNMGTGKAETAAEEASYVSNAMGEKLIAFQLCNEPDLFSRNGLRKPGYSFEDFAAEWQHFYQVITAQVPGAPFAGPDTAFNNEWLVPFAKRFRQQVRFLSQHYYAEGPPTDPAMTIDRLLRPNPKLQAEFDGMQQTRRDSGLPFRLAETNSCYAGGKQGVSDTFASALWGAELMYQLAQAGGEGINFHGGGYGWYTPIAGATQQGFSARPIYYGMLLFAQSGAGRLIENTLDHGANQLLTAHSLRSTSGDLKTAVFNKNEDRPVHLAIDPGERIARSNVLRLTAPSLNAAGGVTLGGASVAPAANWSASAEPLAQAGGGAFILDLPAASAALVTFEKG